MYLKGLQTSSTSILLVGRGKVGETVTFTPSSPKILFYPPSQTITLTTAECPPELPPFEARMGIFLRGHVEPALAGVKIAVSKDNTLVASVTTDASGAYSVGPLPDDAVYSTVHSIIFLVSYCPDMHE